MLGLGNLIRRDLKKITQGNLLNTAEVEVFWYEDGALPSGVAAFDPNLEGSYPARTQTSDTVKALVHFVQPITSGVRQFAEVEAGDVILDLPHDALSTLPTLEAVEFGIDGSRYVQKEAGKGLAEYWDVIVGGQRMMRTLLLKKKR